MRRYRTLLISASTFLLGIAFAFGLLHLRPALVSLLLPEEARQGLAQERSALRPEDPFAAMREQFFGGQDPFAGEDLEEQMRQAFNALGGRGEESGQEIRARETADSVFYEISGIDQTKLNTRVEGGYLTIEGVLQKHAGGDKSGFQTSFQSSFHRSFPLPPNVDAEKMEMSSEGDKVILRFPKRG